MVEEVGGAAYIPFKSNSVVKNSAQSPDSLWERAFHYFHLNRSEFNQHYHKRSNVETTFHMIKAKFGASVRAKTPVAQVNEALVKILCHNIVVLIHSIYDWESLRCSAARRPLLRQPASLSQKWPRNPTFMTKPVG